MLEMKKGQRIWRCANCGKRRANTKFKRYRRENNPYFKDWAICPECKYEYLIVRKCVECGKEFVTDLGFIDTCSPCLGRIVHLHA